MSEIILLLLLFLVMGGLLLLVAFWIEDRVPNNRNIFYTAVKELAWNVKKLERRVEKLEEERNDV